MPLNYLCCCLLAVSIWAGNAVVTKLAAGAVPPGAIAFLRWLIAFAVLTPFVAPAAWRERATIRRYLPRLAGLGLLGMGASQGVGYYAARFTSATNLGLLLALVPLATLLLNTAIRRTRPGAAMVAGVALSLCGIVIVLGQGQPAMLWSEGMGRGDLMLLGVVVGLAAYGVLLKPWSGPLPVLTATYVQIACAVLWLLPVYLWSEPAQFTWPNLAMILYAAIPGSIVAPIVWMAAVRALGAPRTAIFMNLIPVITALIAAMFLGEALHAYHVIGGAMTLVGIALSQRSAPDRAPAGAAPGAR